MKKKEQGAREEERSKEQNEKRRGTMSSMTLLVIATAGRWCRGSIACTKRIPVVTVRANDWSPHVTMDISI